jgi:small conductance mechanosensitive channel
MDTELLDPKYADMAAQLAELGVQYLVNIGSALAVLVIGLILAGLLSRWTRNALSRVDRFDQTLTLFIAKVVKYIIQILVLVTVLAQFGVQTTSMIAALGAAGLAIGLALQGTLANIAAGIMVLVLRPFNVGDYIDAGGISGTVDEIGLFVSQLRTSDGVFVCAPNSELWNSVITNYSRHPTRRLELAIGIGYEDDVDKALQTLLDLATGDQRVLREPAPAVMVKSLDDSAVTIALRAWATTGDFWSLTWDITRRAKETFDQAKISIPYPQRDLHVYQMNSRS